jgi:hypothetical protein
MHYSLSDLKKVSGMRGSGRKLYCHNPRLGML